jgi:hypothetical protein
MQDWNLDEVSDVIEAISNDRWYPTSVREDVTSARILAFLYRQAYRRKISDASVRDRFSARAHNKEVDRVARRLIVSAKQGAGLTQTVSVHPAILMAKRKKSIFLDGLVPERNRRWVPISARMKTKTHERIDVEGFSFLSEPNKTMNTLKRIAEAEAHCLSGQIDFKDKTCLDIGPWLVLAMMRMEMVPIFTGGSISNQMSKIIDALRLHGPLRFTVRPQWDGEQDIWAFPLHMRRAAGTSVSPTYQIDPQAKEKTGDDLCSALNTWLDEAAGQELTLEGRRLVKKIVGECLDNAERHSRREYENDGDWIVSGFMERTTNGNGEKKFQCQIAFLNFGSPISETVQDCADETRAVMDRYVQTHQSQFPNRSLGAGHLRTVFALQDTVTRDRDAYEQGRGGTGFRDIICLFWDLGGGESNATLSIVSGQTCLNIDTTYRDAVFPAPNQPFNFWLNPTNDQTRPPNRAMITDLDSDFRGTLITMAFTLDAGYLETTTDGNS